MMKDKFDNIVEIVDEHGDVNYEPAASKEVCKYCGAVFNCNGELPLACDGECGENGLDFSLEYNEELKF